MKAILVIDKPIDCQHCRLVQHDRGGDYWCPLLGELEYDEMTKIHEDCPLKEMPKKLTDEEISQYEDPGMIKFGYQKGWNACLEEIEK